MPGQRPLHLSAESSIPVERNFHNQIGTQIIKSSVQQAFKEDTQHTHPITKWFTPVASSQTSPEVQWHQNWLLHDPFNKKATQTCDDKTESQEEETNFWLDSRTEWPL